MAWETPGAVSGDVAPSQVLAQESANAFMAKVYRWMFAGLALTGVTSYVVASSPTLWEAIAPLFLPLMIGELVMVLAFSWLAPRASTGVAAAMYLAYSLLNGLTFSVLFMVYTASSITAVFAVTAVMFGAMSVYGTVTKKDLSSWGTFLFMGLIGLILASLVNIFLQSPAVSWVASCVGVVIFVGLTAYDTQKLRQMHATSGYASSGALAINGALILYLDFINLMLYLLRLFGRRR
ncbi:MAG: Bax inhibitor-1/YccA family protein [Archangiaceae bacterium]|nr:Bax inhibitor-1/YccA family protein [Archangiaceae bacterium]